MKALVWGRVLRLSLAPSALADVAAGLLVGGHGQFPDIGPAWALPLASACVYHGGMALNDWADRADDQRTRPDRPIPSGALSARSVLAAGVALVATAVAIAWLVSPACGAWMGALALLVLAYDLGPRGAWLGPLLLAACRAGNLGLGLVYASGLADAPRVVAPPMWTVLPIAYGLYVFSASKIARLEDRSHERGVRGASAFAWLCALLLAASGVLDAQQAWGLRLDPVASLVALAGALALAREAFGRKAWTPADCGRFTGLALRRLMIFTACVALAHRSSAYDGWIVAASIGAGFPLSAALRRVFPPT